MPRLSWRRLRPRRLRLLGRLRLFRYELRCAHRGAIPYILASVGGPRRVSQDIDHARHLLELVPQFPIRLWARHAFHRLPAASAGAGLVRRFGTRCQGQ